jgi:hypothetical protein
MMTLQGADGTPERWFTVSLFTLCTISCSVVSANLLQLQVGRELLSRPWKMRLLACSLGLVVCGLLIASLEFASGLLLRPAKLGEAKLYEGTYLEPDALFRYDDNLGSAMHADRRVSCRLLVGSRVVWDVHYSTDRFGRRRTTFPGTRVPEHTAVFFGCSFLFGEGSEDNQTIPSVFSELSRSYIAVNYGVPGWGTQQMLSLLQSGRVTNEVRNPVALGVYLYLPEVHEARVVGDMDFITESSIGFPCYRLDAEGQPQRLGSFRTARPVTNLFYDIARASRTRALLGLNFPRRQPAHYLLTAAIVARSRDLFLQAFPDARFLMVVYPGGGEENQTIQECRRLGVEVLNLHGKFDPGDPDLVHYGDGHPTPAANRLVATCIAGVSGLAAK